MRQLKALLTAAFVFVAIIPLQRITSDETIPCRIACAVIFALLGYYRGLRLSLPALHLCALLYAVALCSLAHQFVYEGTGEAFHYPRLNALSLATILLYAFPPVLMGWCWAAGRPVAWRAVRWPFGLAAGLLFPLPSLVFQIESNRVLFHLVSFVILSLPALLLGFLSTCPARGFSSRIGSLRLLRESIAWRFRALRSRRGRPLLIKMMQGWLVATFCLLPGLAIETKFFKFDFLWFVLICSIAAVPCYRLGRWMRLAILCGLLTCFEFYNSLGYIVCVRVIRDLFEPKTISALGRPFWAWNLLNYGGGFISGVALGVGLLAIMACALARREFPWRLLKWIYTFSAIWIGCISLSISTFFGMNSSFRMWLEGDWSSWSMMAMTLVLTMPPVLMAWALWLRHGDQTRRTCGPVKQE